MSYSLLLLAVEGLPRLAAVLRLSLRLRLARSDSIGEAAGCGRDNLLASR